MPRAFTAAESEAIRERLLAAGTRAIATTGFRRTPVGALARAAGISQGAFYLFFPSKEALLVTLLQAAEAEVRGRVREVARRGDLEGVLGAIFAAVPSHPLLRALGDPEELAWLTRVLGPAFMAGAHASDQAFFAGLARELKRRGALARDADAGVLGALALVALGVAQQRELLGAAGFERTVALLVKSLAARLRPARPRKEASP